MSLFLSRTDPYYSPCIPPQSPSPNHTMDSFMSSLFCSRKSPRSSSTKSKSKAQSSRSSSYPSTDNQTSSVSNPFRGPTPLRRPRPMGSGDLPPAYSPPSQNATVTGDADSPYAFLAKFDTVFLVDDSGSMAGGRWRETAAALSAITPICTSFDVDGVDIYFLNHRNSMSSAKIGGYQNVQTTSAVEAIFNQVRPFGGTLTGTRLSSILEPYLDEVEQSMERKAHGYTSTLKPLNIIVITDGAAADNVEEAIVTAAKRLDACKAPPEQAGIQFFQIGKDKEAAQDLQELDDALSKEYAIRDMVDTLPWKEGCDQTLSAAYLLKVVLGSVNRKLDRRQVGGATA